MYPITAELANLFANQRQVVRLTFDSVANNIVLTEENIKSGGLVIDRTCVSGDTIEFGSVIASELGVEINNASGQYNSVTFEGAECFVEVGTKDWSDEQTQVQYIPMGYFIVDGSPRKLDTISFKALDRMVKFDRPVDFTQLSFPMTVSALLSSICTICGVTLNTGYQSLWVNKTRNILTAPEGDNLTYRQLLSWICEIMGVCAYMSPAGTLDMHWYGQSQSSTPSIPPSVRYSSDIEENTITLTGVRVINDDTVYLAGTDSYALTIEGNALLQSGYQTVANNIYNARGGLTYTPFTATVKSMPHIYPLDTVNFIKGETTIPTIITNTNFALNNSTVLEGKGKTQIENNYAELNPMTTQQTVVLEKLHSKTVQEFKVADGEVISKIATATSKYDESTSPGTITLRGYELPTAAGYKAAEHSGEYYLNETTGYVYRSNGTSWSKVAELNLITTELETQINQTAEGILFSASQMIAGERTKNLIPFVYNATGSDAKVVNGVKLERNGEGFDLTRTSSSGSNGYFTIYTQDCSAAYDNDKLADVKTLPTGTYIISGTGFNNDIQYRIQYSTDGSTSSKIVYFGENNDTTEKTFSITDAMIYVRHYIWVRSGTDLGSGVTVKPMIRDASIVDDTYTPGIDSGAYMCSAINLTPEKLELDAGKLIINSGNFQLDENGVLTSTAGTFKTSNYTPASGSTKTVGGQIDLGATGSDLIIDTANFKVSGGGAVSAEDANFKNCTIEGGSFEVNSTEQSGEVTSRINLINLYSGDRKQVNISAEKIELSRSFTGAKGDISLDFANGSEIRLASQLGPDYDRAVYSANAIKFDVDVSPNTANISYVDSNDTEQVGLSLGRQGIVLGNNNTPLDLSTSLLTLGNLGGLFISPTLVSAGRSNSILALYGSRIAMSSSSVTVNDRPIATSDEIEARLEATVGHSSKNLLPITLESDTYTEGGANLTYTVDKAAGTITLNGTTRTSEAGYIVVYEDTNGEISGNLYVSGGYSDNCYVRVYDYTNGGYVLNWNGESSRGSRGENDSDEETLISGHQNAVRIRFTANQTFTNVVIKPMIRSGSISDDTFEPYVTPTDERIASLEAQVAALTALINGR